MRKSLIHPTAIIDPKAELDPSVEVGPWCVIGPNVQIQSGCKLLSHVVIDGRTQIGKDNIFFPFSVIGAIPQDLKYKGEPTCLKIGDGNTIRESVTLNLGTEQGGGVTRVGNHNLLMAYSHLGHDSVIGNHCIIANAGTIAGHVIIEDYVTLGGLVAVQQFIKIGAHAYVGGQSGVDKDVPPFTISIGSRPCSIKGANIVGLRRRGFQTSTIQVISEAIKLWMRPDVQKEQCLLEIESQYGDVSEVKRLVEFIRNSESGCIR